MKPTTKQDLIAAAAVVLAVGIFTLLLVAFQQGWVQ